MSLLLIDIGNSRIKWTHMRASQPGPLQAVPLAQFARFERALQSMRGITGVHAVCVAGGAAEARLRAAVRRCGLPRVQFARSTATAAGVTNAYREPWRLGADRWVSAIGAWHLAGALRPVCVVSAGTALTIDVVDARGRHRGGLIVPGSGLMVRTLLERTHGIAVRAANARRTRSATPALPPLASDTRSAILDGSLLACAALVDRTVRDLRRGLTPRPLVFLTGGGAAALAPQLQTPHRSCPPLVLLGLAVLALHRRG